MGILIKITEEYFGETAREETLVKFNTKEMLPVDMGGSVLWADRDLEVESGGEWFRHSNYFRIEDIDGTEFGNGWRLPTIYEYIELILNDGVKRIRERTKKPEEVCFKYGKNRLNFETSGFYDKKPANMLFSEGECFFRLTSEKLVICGDTIHIFFNLLCKPSKAREIMGFKEACSEYKTGTGFYPVRLVKDKK